MQGLVSAADRIGSHCLGWPHDSRLRLTDGLNRRRHPQRSTTRQLRRGVDASRRSARKQVSGEERSVRSGRNKTVCGLRRQTQTPKKRKREREKGKGSSLMDSERNAECFRLDNERQTPESEESMQLKRSAVISSSFVRLDRLLFSRH